MSTSTQTQSASSNSNVADINGVHPSAVGSNTMPDATKTQAPNAESTNKDSVEADHLDSTYPEQKHAGVVGYGPNYNKGAGFVDKITGLKEELKGKVTKNPELVSKGHDRMTGELKHKELDEDAAKDPFAAPDDKKSEAEESTTNGTPAPTPSQASTTTTSA
ncbi:hypothetical protein C8R44DRAFT_892684 [Mycena epipterygia]|nr:hypothetical protein C8R44DRAFT_892684 [Mycena epipterygia]